MFRRFFLRTSAPSLIPHEPKHPFALLSRNSHGQNCSDKVPAVGFDSPTYFFVHTLSSAAKVSSLSTGERSHCTIIKLGLASNLFVNTALMGLYCKCGCLSTAQQLFDEMPERNVVSWNVLIYGYAQSNRPIVAASTFLKMIRAGISPNASSISSTLAACSQLDEQVMGRMLHCFGFKHGFLSNVVVGTALVDMYSKCGNMDVARRAFDEMDERNVITWTSLVTGYAFDRRPQEAMMLFKEMRIQSVKPNKVAYNCLLSSFTMPEDLMNGKRVHCLVIQEGFDSDPYIMATLVTMYSRCGSLKDFINICPSVSTMDQVSCNSVIAGFSHLGDGKEVLLRFLKMTRACIGIDSFTFGSVLRAIGLLSAIKQGRQAHALTIKSRHATDICVQNGLVSMYAKCGAIDDAKQVFCSLKVPDLVSWNSLLAGCAQHGHGLEAVNLFEAMRRNQVIKPNHMTFLSVLTACSHVGLLKEGLQYFNMMKEGDSPIVPELKHYACVVDLLCRAGYLAEAQSFVQKMPIKPGVSIYKAVLSACQVHHDVNIATWAAELLYELCPDDTSTYVMLSNAFATGACWDDAAGLRKAMSHKGLKKKPAWSWIEDRSPRGI